MNNNNELSIIAAQLANRKESSIIDRMAARRLHQYRREKLDKLLYELNKTVEADKWTLDNINPGLRS
jgi:hypothetical protein